MGSRMASNILEAHKALLVFNRTKAKAKSLLESGAEWVETPGELAERSDVVFTMVSNNGAIESLAFGEKGFLKHMRKGTLWVDCSTVNPSFSILEAQEAGKNGIRFLDAPVSGSTMPAEKGELVFLAGGEKKDLEEIQDILSLMGKKTHFLGKHGMGTSMKMVVNSLLGQAMAAYSEAAALAKNLGLSMEDLENVLHEGPLVPAFIPYKHKKLLDHDHETEFPLKHMHKDLFLASYEAYTHNLALPLLNAVKELYGQTKEKGKGDKDFSEIFNSIVR